MKSPFCKRMECEIIEKWLPILPELNFIILKGELIRIRLRNFIVFSQIEIRQIE